MNDKDAELVPTTPIEWEESLVSSSKQSLQQCRQLSEVPHLKPLLRILPARSSLLEAGCGLGQYAYAFASIGHRCMGLDFSYKVLVQARKRGVDLPDLQAQIKWVQGNILNLPIDSETLDCHSSFGVLEHFTRPQQKAILSEAYRSLKPGGILYLFVPNFWSPWTVRRQIRYWYRKMMPPHLVWQKNISRSALHKMCSETGFSTELIQSFYASDALETLSLPSLLSRVVPAPIRAISAKAKADLGQWCDAQDILGYGLVYVGTKRN